MKGYPLRFVSDNNRQYIPQGFVMNDSKFASPKRDRLPFTPIIEGGVEPKTLKLLAHWDLKDGPVDGFSVNRIERSHHQCIEENGQRIPLQHGF